MGKLFELKISDFTKAIELSQTWATHTVSILDTRLKSIKSNLPTAGKNSKLQRYYFNDLNPNYRSYDDFINPQLAIPNAATLEDVKEILAFTSLLQSSDKLLVHCFAGISRSTAVATGILCQHGKTPKEAMEHVLVVRPEAYPNKHILRLFEKVLLLKGQLTGAWTCR